MKLYTQGINPLLKSKIKRVFELALKETQNVDNIEVGLKFVSEEEIKNLNKTNRNVDKVTDVLSFPMTEIKPGEKIEEYKEDLFENVYLGDIAICTKRAREQAKEYRHSYTREICFLALHGFLHILGYDHMTKEDEEVMMALAKKILNQANIRRAE